MVVKYLLTSILITDMSVEGDACAAMTYTVCLVRSLLLYAGWDASRATMCLVPQRKVCNRHQSNCHECCAQQ